MDRQRQPKGLQFKKGFDRRFQAGHPWVFSNELTEVPKEGEPGQMVFLLDAKGTRCASGYFNPRSLISFREVDRGVNPADPLDSVFLNKKLRTAWALREKIFGTTDSFRWIYGEGDGLPGLVIDRYWLDDEGIQILSVECHTAGAEKIWNALFSNVLPFFWENSIWEKTSVLTKNDMGSRKLEGLELESPKWLKALSTAQKGAQKISVGGKQYFVDLENGQKTGFFLDQRENANQLSELMVRIWTQNQGSKPHDNLTFRGLDLFCYVGQWSLTVAQGLKRSLPQMRQEWLLGDSSASALENAKKNLQSLGNPISATTVKEDLVHTVSKMPEASFDGVICDPPALIKSKKDFGPGFHAYKSVFGESIKRVSPGGIIVLSSCSMWLSPEDFRKAVSAAEIRAGKSGKIAWISEGIQAYDHPLKPGFPEGRYLKVLMGIVE